jgi:spore coat polysaccharide biosynthesis protein SpsF
MICRQLERIQQAARVDSIIVATSCERGDDAIAETAAAMKIDCFRGSLDDVLDRVYRAGESSGAEHIVRLTADCPLIDAQVLDQVVEKHLSEGNDYTSNFLQRRYPDGLDVEIVNLQSLEKSWKEATAPSDREHVTPFIYGHPDRFSLGSLRCDQNLAAERWTVDYPEDFEFITRIFETLYPRSAAFSMWDVLELLAEQPDLVQINASRRETLQ